VAKEVRPVVRGLNPCMRAFAEDMKACYGVAYESSGVTLVVWRIGGFGQEVGGKQV
jgi:hypothetical protein